MDSLPPSTNAPPSNSGHIGAIACRYAAFAGALLLIVFRIAARPWAINHDVAMYLDCGRMLVRGMRPYVDFTDLNPPMIMYVSALPALLSSLLPVDLIFAFHFLVLCFVFYSAISVAFMLERPGTGFRSVEASIAGLVVILFSAGLMLTSYSDWGQREHLFMLGYLPFFLCRWNRWEERASGIKASLLFGFLAGISVCLKPHFVVIALVIEAFHLARAKRVGPLFAPEMIPFVFTGAAYALHFIFLPESVREAFFEFIVPMVRKGYRAYDSPLTAVIFRPGVVVAGIGVLVSVAIGFRSQNSKGRLGLLFGLVSGVNLLLYLQQRKGWTYIRA